MATKTGLQVSPPHKVKKTHPTSRACEVWTRSRKTADSFLKTFDDAQAARGGGAPTDHEQDFLRAMLVFACAGLDGALGHLGRDCAVEMLDRSPALKDEARNFYREQLGIDKSGADFLMTFLQDAGVLNLDETLVTTMLAKQTTRSLQSHEAILRIAGLFGVTDPQFTQDTLALRPVFQARNNIIHEMDVEFGGVNRTRTARRRKDIVQDTEAVLNVTAQLIRGVQDLL